MITNKILRVLRITLMILPEHPSDTQVFTVKMEILLEPTSNKLLKDSILHTRNLVKEILSKLNLPDHRSILMDLKIHIKMDMEVNMDDPNITMEEYIRLQEEKALSHGKMFNWQTTTYGKREYYDNEDDRFTNFETKFPAIVFDDITSNTALSCEPTVSPLNDNEIDFRISFDESDDEDYT
ncbi:hypothetical protein Tco_0329017, partial [Tanacetum coccineum]